MGPLWFTDASQKHSTAIVNTEIVLREHKKGERLHTFVNRVYFRALFMSTALAVEERKEVGTRACKMLRSEGFLPGVVYGAGKDTRHFKVRATDFEKVWRSAGESSIVDVSGIGETLSVLITDVTVDPIYGAPVHVDLLAVRTDEVVTVSVPLIFSGSAPAEKELGGTLIKVMHELEIEALPKDLPHDITVDISGLKSFDDQIHVRDIVLPTGVVACVDADEVVALVQEVVEQEEQSTEPVDLSAIEVEKKGKVEEEAEE